MACRDDKKCRRLTVLSLSGSRSILMCGSENRASAAIALPFRRFSNGCRAEHPRNRSLPTILSSNPRTSWQYMLMPRNWRQGVGSRKGEAAVRRAFRRSWLSCWATFSRNRKAHFEMGFQVAAISGFWNTLARADLSWSRPTEISNVCWPVSVAPTWSFSVRATIQLELRPRYSVAMRSALPSCPVRRIG